MKLHCNYEREAGLKLSSFICQTFLLLKCDGLYIYYTLTLLQLTDEAPAEKSPWVATDLFCDGKW